MSLALAMSAFNSKEAKEHNYSAEYAGKNVKALLNETGFKDIDISAYEGKPSENSIGVAFANKVVEDGSSLIVVAIRGGGYEDEWAGNFNMTGLRDYHDGFATAAYTVLDSLGKYIDSNRITGDVKVWIVGYSRAAATANLVAQTLDDILLRGYSQNLTL